MIDPELHRLAMHCAIGPKQKDFVKELLEGKVQVIRDTSAYRPYWMTSAQNPFVYGKTRLPSSSFVNLRKRLNHVGFRFERDALPEGANEMTPRYISMKY